MQKDDYKERIFTALSIIRLLTDEAERRFGKKRIELIEENINAIQFYTEKLDDERLDAQKSLF